MSLTNCNETCSRDQQHSFDGAEETLAASGVGKVAIFADRCRTDTNKSDTSPISGVYSKKQQKMSKKGGLTLAHTDSNSYKHEKDLIEKSKAPA